MKNLESNERYQFIRKLGDGGMGEVFLVEHQGLGRREALKVLHKKLASSPQFISRFRREARALNRLKHSNIVCVYDFGVLPDGDFYLSTEYADGQNMRAILEAEGGLPPWRAVRLLTQLADAIMHAHSRGVIHRDLKPENLIVEKDHRGRDVLKVLDFGIAKIVAADYEDSTEITKQGSIYGTPQYMSPEQVRGEGDDPRIDIYALGCIAFELIAGTPPFTGRIPMDIMRAQVYDPLPQLTPHRLQDTIPLEYEAFVRQCLAKQVEDRYQSAREILDALDELGPMAESPTAESPNRRKSVTTILYNPLPVANMDTLVAQQEERGEFDDVTTVVDVPGQYPTSRPRRAESVTKDLNSESVSMDRMLLDLAERLLAVGCDSVMLGVQVSLIEGMRAELDQGLDEIEELEQRRSQLEERARHSEASLRFSLGELHFERERAKDRDPSLLEQLAPHIEALQKRLAESSRGLERDLQALDERKTFLEGVCIEREQELDRTLVELQRLLYELAPAHTHDADVARLLEQVELFTPAP